MWKFWENILYYIYRYISTIFNMLIISLFKPLESLKMLCLISQQMCNLFNILKILMLHVIKCYHLLEFFLYEPKVSQSCMPMKDSNPPYTSIHVCQPIYLLSAVIAIDFRYPHALATALQSWLEKRINSVIVNTVLMIV